MPYSVNVEAASLLQCGSGTPGCDNAIENGAEIALLDALQSIAVSDRSILLGLVLGMSPAIDVQTRDLEEANGLWDLKYKALFKSEIERISQKVILPVMSTLEIARHVYTNRHVVRTNSVLGSAFYVQDPYITIDNQLGHFIMSLTFKSSAEFEYPSDISLAGKITAIQNAYTHISKVDKETHPMTATSVIKQVENLYLMNTWLLDVSEAAIPTHLVRSMVFNLFAREIFISNDYTANRTLPEICYTTLQLVRFTPPEVSV